MNATECSHEWVQWSQGLWPQYVCVRCGVFRYGESNHTHETNR